MQNKNWFLLVVILLVTAVGIAGMKRWSEWHGKKKYFKCITRLHELGSQLETYRFDNRTKHFPKNLPPGLQNVGCDADKIGYVVNGDASVYTVFCSGSHHLAVGLGADEPEYSSILGPHLNSKLRL